MAPKALSPVKRRPVNLSLDEAVVAEARSYGISLSRTSEEALTAAVKTERERRWKEENRAAIEGNNRWIEQNGLPLEKYRLF